MSFLIYGKLITLILAVEAPFLILVDLGAGGMTKRDDDTFAKEKDQGHQIPVQSTTACSQDSLFSVDGLAWDAPTATTNRCGGISDNFHQRVKCCTLDYGLFISVSDKCHYYTAMDTNDRRYYPPPPLEAVRPTAEDLHAWSIYRQNINSELSSSALGDQAKVNALPYGNFALRPHQVDAILHRAKRASVSASSELLNSTNAMTYLKFGLPRVTVPLKSVGSSTPDSLQSKHRLYGSRGVLYNASTASVFERNSRLRKSRSELDLRGPRGLANHLSVHEKVNTRPNGGAAYFRDHPPVRSPSEGDIHRVDVPYGRPVQRGNSQFDLASSVGYRSSSGRAEHRRPDVRYAGQQTRSGETGDLIFFKRGVHATNDVNHAAVRKITGTVNLLPDPPQLERSKMDSNVVTSRNCETRQSERMDYVVGRRGIGENSGQDTYALQVPHLLNENFLANKDNFSSSIAKSQSRRTDIYSSVYPNIQVRSFSLTKTENRKSDYSFSAVTFEAKSGDLVGIMATSDEQGDDLLRALVNRRGKWGTSLKGAITYNGVNVDPKHVAERAVYAGTNLDFNSDMSLKQTMLFQSHLVEPGEANRKSDTKGRIEALISDLGLSNVAATRVAELTRSEKQRLNIACQLLADPDLVLLERPTHNMDIFDTFFLIEYLRQWALRGRIVILTMHPPTFEIFNMLTTVLVLTNGRTIFSGKRKDMIPYFESVDYPCPAQKNPADYYIDLVSRDMTSPEANEESGQRIEHLSSNFTQRQPNLSDLSHPGVLPPKIWTASPLWQVIVLWIRALIFQFPYNLIEAIHQIIQNVAMSVLIGVIYFGLNRNQASADDRMGLLYVILTIGIWPMIIHLIQKEYRCKKWLHKDLMDRTYSKGSFLFAKMLYSVPVTAISIGAYIIPVYFMTRLRQDDDFRSFGIYIGMMYLHILSWRALAKLLVYILPSAGWVALPLTTVAVLSFLTSGYPIHPNQIWKAFKWFEWISPTQWSFQQLAQQEFNGIDRFNCQKIPVQMGGLPILTSPNCGLENGRDILSFMNISRHASLPQELWKAFVAVGMYNVGIFLLAFIAFMLIQQRPQRKSTEN